MGELHTYFRAAGRASPASVAAAVAQHGSAPPVTVSRETVRKLLKGETTSTWPKVKAVHEVLSHSRSGPEPSPYRISGSAGLYQRGVVPRLAWQPRHRHSLRRVTQWARAHDGHSAR